MVIVSVAVIALILSFVCIVLVFTKSSDNDNDDDNNKNMKGQLDELQKKYQEIKSFLCKSGNSLQPVGGVSLSTI